MLMVALVALASGERDAFFAFVTGAGLPLVVGVVVQIMFGADPNAAKTQNVLRYLLLFWVSLPMVSVWPVWRLAPEIGVTGALFEMVSGFTTTGATVLDILPSDRDPCFYGAA